MSTVREVTYEVLRDLGMNLIFGNPGSTELPFLRDMPPDFQYILALHERSAIGIGLGYAMAKGKAAFVNVHSVASVGNGLSALKPFVISRKSAATFTPWICLALIL